MLTSTGSLENMLYVLFVLVHMCMCVCLVFVLCVACAFSCVYLWVHLGVHKHNVWPSCSITLHAWICICYMLLYVFVVYKYLSSPKHSLHSHSQLIPHSSHLSFPHITFTSHSSLTYNILSDSKPALTCIKHFTSTPKLHTLHN